MKLPFALASRFVAGENFEQAAPKIRELNKNKIRATLDLLGENVRDKAMADVAVEKYIELLQLINATGLDSSISIKLTMIGLDIDSRYCRDNLFRLLEVARELDHFVRIDMEASAYTQATLDLYKQARKVYDPHVGIVIQAYLHRSKADIAELAKLGADVRLCKGAYSEPVEIALQRMPQIREAFKSYAAALLEKTPFPRFATHDDELLSWIKQYTAERGFARERYEFQMLYGLREKTVKELAADGYNTRVYVPFGTMWLPYFKRRLMERKENIWFVLSTLFKN